MPDRIPRRAALAVAGALLALAAVAAPAAAAAGPSGGASPGAPSSGARSSGAPSSRVPSSGTPSPRALPQAIGGPLLSGRGVIVNAARSVPSLPRVHASAFIIADAGTGQVRSEE